MYWHLKPKLFFFLIIQQNTLNCIHMGNTQQSQNTIILQRSALLNIRKHTHTEIIYTHTYILNTFPPIKSSNDKVKIHTDFFPPWGWRGELNSQSKPFKKKKKVTLRQNTPTHK